MSYKMVSGTVPWQALENRVAVAEIGQSPDSRLKRATTGHD
jgi:hypothetical protein